MEGLDRGEVEGGCDCRGAGGGLGVVDASPGWTEEHRIDVV